MQSELNVKPTHVRTHDCWVLNSLFTMRKMSSLSGADATHNKSI